jgi:hypothetical protein
MTALSITYIVGRTFKTETRPHFDCQWLQKQENSESNESIKLKSSRTGLAAVEALLGLFLLSQASGSIHFVLT